MSKYARATRKNSNTVFDDNPMEKFCLAMDNYFTLPKLIKRLRDLGVGVVGTARFKQNWPPKKMKDADKSAVNFNDFFYCYDEHGTLLGRWMDNGLVFCVSTLHKVGKIIKRVRKRPRKTAKNKQHIDKVWGDQGKASIYIPTLIDDYNHWMGGVDLCDQRIAYYQPNLRCRRNWIPMFLQIMSIIRSNSYVVYKSCAETKPIPHKKFTLEMIGRLMENANMHQSLRRSQHNNSLAKAAASAATKSSEPPPKRQRHASTEGSSSIISKFPQRHLKPRLAHVRTALDQKFKGACIVCSQLYADRKAAGETIDWDKVVKRTKMVCRYCTENSEKKVRCYLCKEHHDTFHDTY